MANTNNLAISIYTEDTPNPSTMKFVVNKLLYPGKTADFTNKEEAAASPLARALFTLPFIRGVFIASNFITLTKTREESWEKIIPGTKAFLIDYLGKGQQIIDEKLLESAPKEKISSANDDETVLKIKEVLETYVQPVVEMDGGAIYFKEFKQGTLFLILQGACSGCPSAKRTLKKGVESIMKRHVPEVKEVKETAE